VPDVVLMDYRMPGLNGAEATRAVLTACPSTRVVCLSASVTQQEIDEVRAEFAAVAADPGDGAARERLEDEMGDLLFVCANLARHAKVDVGNALRRANLKFERRFRHMEALAAEEGVALSSLPLEAQDAYWNRAKAEERK